MTDHRPNYPLRENAADQLRAASGRQLVEITEEAARAGERMPEKSTYFYPKLVGGLLFSPFDE